MINNKYSYCVYGLYIDSSIKLPELMERSFKVNENDVIKIYFGQVPNEIQLEIDRGKSFSIEPQYMWHYYDDIGIIWLKNGKEVIIQKIENYNYKRLKNIILSNTLGNLLLQREEVAIHGASIVINNNSIIITGSCGAGKTSLALALEEKGYKFLADDIAAIKLEEKSYIEYGFPYHKLCEDAVEKLGYNKDELDTCMGAYETKFIAPDREGFTQERVTLKAIFEISVGVSEELRVRELKSSEILQGIMKNIYHSEYKYKMGGFSPDYFKLHLQLAQRINYYEIVRPRNKYTVDEIIKVIENKVKGCE